MEQIHTTADLVVTFKCHHCGSVEQVTSVNATYFGSQYDFCDACGEARDEDTDVVTVEAWTMAEVLS